MAASPANAANANVSAGASRASVLLPLPLDVAYDYRVPEGMAAEPGHFVEVPLGGRALVGVVWEGGGDPAVAEGRLRPLARRLDVPPMTAALRRLIDWVAAYTLAPRGAVLRMAMSVPEALEPPRPRTGLVAGGTTPPRMTPARTRVLALAADGVPREALDLAREGAVGPAVVRGLLQAGALAAVPLPARIPFRTPDAAHAVPRLSPDQQAAAADLAGKVGQGAFSVTLLDGVTGAGKTEVYFDAMATALAAGRQALVLLPEIALGSQWLERFVARFGTEPAPWHSELTMAARRHVWRAVAEGRAPVVVGARSALFLPFPDLGLVVVDEEHDASYKQEEGVIYHARDMAVVRARLSPCPAVLASATPSLETVANVQDGRYALCHLPDRHGGASLPAVSVLDMRREGPADRRHWLAPRLVAAVETALAGGEQAMLFLNRRGYAPLTLCRHCGHRFECPNCSAWLVEHRLTSRLQCHHCGFAMPLPDACPACGTAGKLAPCGPGVERLAEEAAARWPGARLAVMASDTIESPRAAADLVRRMTEREIDLLIGTQIVAKGHHFPWLTLVGVVDADLGLAGGDLRAAERTYQLLHQVAGRAGRAERAGQVVLQTYMAEHKVLQALASGDRDRFVAAELEERRHHAMPPFGRLAALIVSGVGEERVRRTAAALARAAPQEPGVVTLGPAPAPMSLLRGRTRWRLLLKAPRGANVQRILRAWLERVKVPSAVRVQVDVDPYSFL